MKRQSMFTIDSNPSDFSKNRQSSDESFSEFETENTVDDQFGKLNQQAGMLIVWLVLLFYCFQRKI